MRAFAASAVLLLLVLLPAAAAQPTLVQPIRGAFTDVYLITGRAVDANGGPVAGADLTIELVQQGVRAAPLQATTNCRGDFITSFTLKAVSHKGYARLTLEGRDGVPNATARADFDPFHRRTDAVVRLEGPWNYRCPEDVWNSSVTITGRIVNRTQPYERDGVTYESEPYGARQGRMRYEDGGGSIHCAPPPNGPPTACDFLAIDERGDFRYTFVFQDAVEAKGRMRVVLGDKEHVAEVDPVTRQAVLFIEATGQGAPPAPTPANTPGPAPLLLVLAAAAAALVARRALRAGR